METDTEIDFAPDQTDQSPDVDFVSDEQAVKSAVDLPQQITNTLTRTLASGAEGSQMARELPQNRLEAAYESAALPPGAQEGRERLAGGYGYGESLLPIPTFTPKEGEPAYATIGKEVANIALGIPKFLTSPTGITAAPFAAVAPTFTAGAFTEDMLNSLGEQAAKTYKDWAGMTPTQKRAAVTQMAGTGLFAGLTGAATIKGLRGAPEVAPKPPEAPPEAVSEPLATPEAQAAEQARLAAELGQEEAPAAAASPTPEASSTPPTAPALVTADAILKMTPDEFNVWKRANQWGPQKVAEIGATLKPEQIDEFAKERDKLRAQAAENQKALESNPPTPEEEQAWQKKDFANQIINLKAQSLNELIDAAPKPVVEPPAVAPEVQTEKQYHGKTLDEWLAIKSKEDLPKGDARDEFRKLIGAPVNQPQKIFQYLKANEAKIRKRIAEINKPPISPTEAVASEPANPAEPPTVTPLSIALDELKSKGWDPKWPFVPADLENKSFRDAIQSDPSLSEADKAKILSFGPGGANELRVTTPPPPPPEPPKGMGAAVSEEFERNPSTPTGIRNAIVDQERTKRGLPAAMEPARRSFGEVWDRAMAIIDHDPATQDNLLDSLRDKPRALTDAEDALILHRQIDLQNEYGKATRDLAQAFDDGRLEDVEREKLRVAGLSDKLLDIYNIGKTAGTETARGLAARRMMANEDFSLAQMTTEKRAANGGKPLTDAQKLEVERLHKIIALTLKALEDYRKKLAERRGGGPPPTRPPALDPTEQTMAAANERAKAAWIEALARDRLRIRSPLEKAQDAIIKWRRAFILSSPITLAKLTSAAAERMTITPIEEAAGSLIGRAIPSVASKAAREGGINARAEAKALTEGFTKGARDSWDVLRTGRSSLDVLYGRAAGYPPGVSDFFGHVHGALKSIPKRNEFARSFEKRSARAIDQGVDVSDPLVQANLAVESYKDANRAIFQQDNRVVTAYKAALRYLESKSKETGRVPLSSKAVATVGKILLPIVRIPTNIVAETLQTSTGLITGSARLGRAFYRGIENLSPQEADIIMRSLKKGSIGGALLALGYLNPDVIGGYYQPGKRKPGQQGFGTLRLYGHDIPSYLLHNPLLETLQIGATARKLAEAKISKKDAEAAGVGWGALGAGMGLLEEVPFLREPIEIAKAFNPNERRAFFGELFKSLTVPQAVSWWAAYNDTDKYGRPIQRKPVTLMEHEKTGIPGLRETVPAKK